jgi:bifunctional UDP-N-acetylglucosamine pyrophosphorylase/glucosamine-1-phosphate N-acetyltransferase
LLARGVTLADPERVDIRGTLTTGMDVRIDVNCIFEGDVRLGNDVKIGAHCVLNNVSVADGCEILPFSHLTEATIGENARIGPFSRIRPGAQLGADVHIGNFVEVKASELGDGAKVNHLSYVGDSTVGKNVNVGAGTITCNYDGAFKHRTIIEDDVHIGSDVQLVAPVTVGRGATVGAGTTVWKNVPPGGLVLNTKDQVQRPDWKRPSKDRG